MRSWAIVPLAMLVLPACDRDRGDEPAVVADTLATESADVVRDLLAPIRSVSLAAVEFGDMGAQRAQRDDVRQYARTVATDHRALVAVLDSAAAARTTTLEETPSSQELGNAVRMAHSGLETLQPADFDQAFVRAELESHRQLLDRLDMHVIPAARSPEMKALATDTRAMVDAHLTRARQILAALLGQPAVPATLPPAAGERPAPQPVPRDTTPVPIPPPPPDTTSARGGA
jgi:predicted outer membrane protein